MYWYGWGYVFQQIQRCLRDNLSLRELVLLLAVIAAAVPLVRRRPSAPWGELYSIFFIVYITLLRREPIARRQIVLYPAITRQEPDWIGYLLNTLLYLPFGAVLARRRHQRWGTVALYSFALSFLCEALQFCTRRGQADVNDLLFNVLGALLGSLFWRAVQKRNRK